MGYRMPAPPVGDLIAWPVAFGTRFTLFCDVEEEFDWTRPLSRDQQAVTATAALPAAHRRFREGGAGLTCMVDYPVVADARAVDHLAPIAADARSAIGAQLHPWVTPPHEEPVSPANSYAGNLPPALEGAKIDRLTDAIAAAFGRSPRAYRAGRYGIGPATIGLLAARGYRLDTSVRAGFDYREDGGPDFGAIGNAAWRIGDIVELPFSTVYTGALRRWGGAVHAVARLLPPMAGLLAHGRLLNRVPLTPEGVPIAEALAAVDAAVATGERLLAFSFHSPSLVPGNTPYVRDAADLATFWRWWSAMFDHLARLGVTYASLDDILAAAGEAERHRAVIAASA